MKPAKWWWDDSWTYLFPVWRKLMATISWKYSAEIDSKNDVETKLMYNNRICRIKIWTLYPTQIRVDPPPLPPRPPTLTLITWKRVDLNFEYTHWHTKYKRMIYTHWYTDTKYTQYKWMWRITKISKSSTKISCPNLCVLLCLKETTR